MSASSNSRSTKQTADDMKTPRLVEEAWKGIEDGRDTVFTPDEFIEELKSWARR